MVIGIGVYLLSKGTGRTFIFDEWMFVADRHGFSPSSILPDHNGHLVALPAIVYMIVFETFGLNGYWFLAGLAVAAHLTAASVIFAYVARRHTVFVGLAAGTLVALSGIGAENYVWGFQIGFTGAVLSFILAILAFDNREKSCRWRVGTCVLLVSGLCFSGVGVAALGAMAIVVLTSNRLRRDWWVVVVPAVLYALWYLGYAEQIPNARASSGQILRFFLDGSSGSISGTFGVDLGWGRLAFGVLIAWVIVDWKRRGFDVRRYVWLVFSLVFWLITAYSRAGFGDALSSRYLWVGQICVVLTICELAKSGLGERGSRRCFVPSFALVVLLAFFGSRGAFDDNVRFQVSTEEVATVRSSIASLNRDSIGADAPIHSIWGYTLIDTQEFFEAIDRFGVPRVFDSAELRATSARRVATDVAMSDFGLMPIEPSNEPCSASSATTELGVVDGVPVRFQVEETAEVEVQLRVFSMPADGPEVPRRQLAPGTYEAVILGAFRDSPLSLTFSVPVVPCE